MKTKRLQTTEPELQGHKTNFPLTEEKKFSDNKRDSSYVEVVQCATRHMEEPPGGAMQPTKLPGVGSRSKESSV